ncbi:chemotaxis protein CheB [Pleionea sp. CnH1-48]|uniref:chemotaxis protein CheB n=1 Tax=Pleionea sp. CnH1-48 TaxID=2954494 RepID=UPI0020982A12|nr:chemotaxis protein CheB [Pleionea sp. CnH1-48]MCO7225250.1 hypothetical protein [Pleionea sp. CnH1-48]
MKQQGTLSLGIISSGGEETESLVGLLKEQSVAIEYCISPEEIAADHIAAENLHVWLLDIDDNDWSDALDDLLDQSSIPVFFNERGSLGKQTHPEFWCRNLLQRLYEMAGIEMTQPAPSLLDDSESAALAVTMETEESIIKLDDATHQLESVLDEITDDPESSESSFSAEELTRELSELEEADSPAEDIPTAENVVAPPAAIDEETTEELSADAIEESFDLDFEEDIESIQDAPDSSDEADDEEVLSIESIEESLDFSLDDGLTTESANENSFDTQEQEVTLIEESFPESLEPVDDFTAELMGVSEQSNEIDSPDDDNDIEAISLEGIEDEDFDINFGESVESETDSSAIPELDIIEEETEWKEETTDALAIDTNELNEEAFEVESELEVELEPETEPVSTLDEGELSLSDDELEQAMTDFEADLDSAFDEHKASQPDIPAEVQAMENSEDEQLDIFSAENQNEPEAIEPELDTFSAEPELTLDLDFDTEVASSDDSDHLSQPKTSISDSELDFELPSGGLDMDSDETTLDTDTHLDFEESATDEVIESSSESEVESSDDFDIPLLEDTAVNMVFEVADDEEFEDVESEPELPDLNVWVLGASLGGPAAVKRFLQALPSELNVAFVLAQHIDENFLPVLANILDTQTPFSAQIIEQQVTMEPGTIYIAPIKHNIVFGQDKTLGPKHTPWTPPYAPCIDDVIKAAATVYQSRCGAIVFSGMGDDGKAGILQASESGCKVWAQQPDTCANSSMPDSVIETDKVEYIGSPEELAERLAQLYNSVSVASPIP